MWGGRLFDTRRSADRLNWMILRYLVPTGKKEPLAAALQRAMLLLLLFLTNRSKRGPFTTELPLAGRPT